MSSLHRILRATSQRRLGEESPASVSVARGVAQVPTGRRLFLFGMRPAIALGIACLLVVLGWTLSFAWQVVPMMVVEPAYLVAFGLLAVGGGYAFWRMGDV